MATDVNGVPYPAQMDLVDAPNATAIAAIQSGLAVGTVAATAAALGSVQSTVNTLATSAALGSVQADVDLLATAAALGTVQSTVDTLATAAGLGTVQSTVDLLATAAALGTVQSTVDLLATAAALGTVQTTVNQIDDAATLGLGGVANSLAYRVGEVERHFHSNERWTSKLASPAGDRVTESAMTPFVAVSGNNAYGSALQIMDTADGTALFSGAVKYDVHRLFISDMDHTTPYRLRISYGTGDAAAAVSAGQYSEMMIRSDNTNGDRTPLTMQMRRVDVSNKAWVEVWNATNASEVDFFVGLHFYEG